MVLVSWSLGKLLMQAKSKKALRAAMALTLRALQPSVVASQSEQAAVKLRSLPEYKKATCIAFYLHMDSAELQTDKMITNAFSDNKCVFLPQIIPVEGQVRQHAKQKMHLCMRNSPNIDHILSLEPKGKYKLREPESGTDCFEVGGLDMIVLPGVAFTTKGERLGHGMGYYDSFILEHEKHTGRRPALVAVGFKEQIVEELPFEPHDQIVDVVIAAGEVYRAH